MKKPQKIITIATLLIIISCNNSHQSNAIQLNNGNKWSVNAEMKPHIETAEELLHKFVSQNNKDYRKLAEKLKIQNNALIKSCTMKGSAHNELHKWLHPHIKLIEKLANTNDYNEAKRVISEIQKSFNNYNNSFQ